MSTKSTTPNSTITRDLRDFDKQTENIYESVVVVSKRANQLSANLKEELQQKLSEFVSPNDTLEEVFENREQIEISKRYERLPKPSLVAIEEFLNILLIILIYIVKCVVVLVKKIKLDMLNKLNFGKQIIK